MARAQQMIDALEQEIQRVHRALDAIGAPVAEQRTQSLGNGRVTTLRTFSLVERIQALGERLQRHAQPVPRGGGVEWAGFDWGSEPSFESTLDEMM